MCGVALTNPEKIADALAALCRAAMIAPGDGSPEAARAVVATLRRTGCLRDETDPHSPDLCSVALWILRRTQLGVLVSGATGKRGRGTAPGLVILLGDRHNGRRECQWVELPPAIDAAITLLADGEGVAAVRERAARKAGRHRAKRREQRRDAA